MAKMSQIHDEEIAEEQGNKYVVYFLNDDEEQSVSVEEVKEVNFSKVIKHINHGGSVFIASRRKPKHNISFRKASF